MNQEKLAKLQSQVRIGGKGTARRKKKVVHRTATTDDKKLQSSLKKLTVNSIPGIEEVNMFKDDGSVIHFNNPKVQASLAANTFAISGQAEQKRLAEMMPGILNQLRPENLDHLKSLASALAGNSGNGSDVTDMAAAVAAMQNAGLDSSANPLGTVKEDDEDEVPQLVENFDEAAQIKE
ncbi:hypothetical protein RDWZM_003814 [Blomia tropicalis]|uniref:Transcription factor BTF3 n=1 Tax=Blomia tropicalis TaxID=40697 RepID=A0A9Q0MGB1_BLOTA|nr:Transcription factor BTF3 4 [Blomia tropicalis]KAJ6225269.1 hypothetical protein RDWZM_003814 [Blomia tropicalis]